MFVLEYKVNPKPHQIQAIEEAIKTVQFVRNKALRYWMDNHGVGKTELFRYNTKLRDEFEFVSEVELSCLPGWSRAGSQSRQQVL